MRERGTSSSVEKSSETKEKRSRGVWKKWLGLSTLILAVGGGLYVNREDVDSAKLPKDKITEEQEPRPDFGLEPEDLERLSEDELKDVKEAVDELDTAVRDARERVRGLPKNNTETADDHSKTQEEKNLDETYLNNFFSINDVGLEVDRVISTDDNSCLILPKDNKSTPAFHIQIDDLKNKMFTIILPLYRSTNGITTQIFGEAELKRALEDYSLLNDETRRYLAGEVELGEFLATQERLFPGIVAMFRPVMSPQGLTG
ncbi:MAG: hypothetical protein HYV41_03355 [Candidatus Magasanikbacteria bacterium]|nr:hypothetical protein [Candidatus Magasanikbacteria bacterium]